MPRVIHFQIHADDPERAIRFYSKLFGWRFDRWNDTHEYWSIITGPDQVPGINGGLVRRSSSLAGDAISAFVCTVGVEDLDATVERVVAEGGSVALPRMAIPGIGWLAYVKDSEANTVGLMEPDITAHLPRESAASEPAE